MRALPIQGFLILNIVTIILAYKRHVQALKAAFLNSFMKKVCWLVTKRMGSLSEVIIFLFLFLKFSDITLCFDDFLFKHVLATTDYLTKVTIFTATSRVECGIQCLLEQDHNVCTAFALDEIIGTCTCGRKRFAPVQVTGSEAKLYVGVPCPKIKTGNSQNVIKYMFSLCSYIILGCFGKNVHNLLGENLEEKPNVL